MSNDFLIKFLTDPNKIYQKGWEDAINGRPRYIYKRAYLFTFFKDWQRLYDNGYRNGSEERTLRNPHIVIRRINR